MIRKTIEDFSDISFLMNMSDAELFDWFAKNALYNTYAKEGERYSILVGAERLCADETHVLWGKFRGLVEGKR
jgi:hypothetical protein